jgi:RNA polymerase sigma-70 factor (sigma-E family)
MPESRAVGLRDAALAKSVAGGVDFSSGGNVILPIGVLLKVGPIRRSLTGTQQLAEFDDFARTTGPSLFRTAVVITGDRGHAEDLVQTTLLRTARRWSVAAESPKAYAFRVLINLGRDRTRQLRRRVPEDLNANFDMSPPSHPGVDLTDAIEDREVLIDALSELSVAQREVVVLRFLVDLSVADTAGILGISEGTVKSTTAKATARLRVLLTTESTIGEVPGDY